MTTKAERLAAGTILLHERKLRNVMTSDVDAAVTSTAASLQRGRRGEPMRRAAVLLAIVVASRALATTLYPRIVTGRDAVRTASRARLGAELAASGILGFEIAKAQQGPDEDHARATMAADGLALGWRSVAMATLVQGERDGVSPGKAIERTRKLMAPRIARTAATETATAYNAERVAVVREKMDREPRFAEAIAKAYIVRQWSALADACPKCIPFDGQIARLDGNFPGGYEPGDVHVHCRCDFIVVSASEQEYAEAA